MNDEAAMEAYLEGEEPSNDKLRELIRIGTIAAEYFPVLCGSAFKNKGVQPLLDAVVDFLPSPVDIPAIKGIDVKTEEETTRKASDDEPLGLLAFKIMNDPFVGSLTFCAHLFGQAGKGFDPASIRSRTSASASAACCRCIPTTREDIKDTAYAGDIVATCRIEGNHHR